MPALQIFVTGGTFEKEYDPITEKLVFRKSHVPRILERAKVTADVRINQLMLVDSLYMTPQQREELVQECVRSPYAHIVITHGTSTMEDTAREIAARVKDKTIVLTGSMVPYSLGEQSDAFFNLGAAVAFAQALPAGVYVAMNGQYFEAMAVTKNVSAGVFELK